MSKLMTREQVARLAPYEKQMVTAIRSDYARGVYPEMKAVMVEVFREYSGNRNYSVFPNCAGCTKNLLKDVGIPYLEAKNYYDAMDAAAETESREAVEAKAKRMRGKKVKTQL